MRDRAVHITDGVHHRWLPLPFSCDLSAWCCSTEQSPQPGAGTSAAVAADRFTFEAAPPPPLPPPGGNLVPNPGFESAGMPVDYWGGQLARSTDVVRSESSALAQTTSSTSGGWDLDANPSWYAPVASTKTYTATVWVRASKTTKVVLNIDLLKSNGSYANTADGSKVTLVAFEPNFSNATSGTVITWDDMSITAN